MLFGLLGGALMSRNMLRRLDTINRASGEIMAGNLTRRVPVSGAHDEFDILAENLNRMLDRIERLMKGLREVTDSVAHDLRTPLNPLAPEAGAIPGAPVGRPAPIPAKSNAPSPTPIS